MRVPPALPIHLRALLASNGSELVAGRQISIALGTYPTAVEAAYAYARYMAGDNTVTRKVARPSPDALADGATLAHTAVSPSSGLMMRLHLAPGTLTGYRGVGFKNGRARPYQARLPGGATLGYFATSLEAATAYADSLAG